MTARATGSTKAGQILVLDDDSGIREALSLILSDAGYQVVCCADGETLLTLARRRTPHCVILDLLLPQSSGLEVLKELRQQSYSGPVLMISSSGSISNAVAAIKGGAFDFMLKPFRSADLVAKVDAVVQAYDWEKPETELPMPGLHFPNREPLTERERDVLQQLASGLSNKEAGRLLGLSPRTIESYRARIMSKLGAKNIADLFRMVLAG